jgi:hypothetical protein
MTATLAPAGFMSPSCASGSEADQPWLASLWERMRELDRNWEKMKLENVAIAPPPFSWTSRRDSGYDRGRDDGFGL